MQIVTLVQIPLQGIVGFVPAAKVVQFSFDFFGSAAGGVGVEGKFGIGLLRLVLVLRHARLGH